MEALLDHHVGAHILDLLSAVDRCKLQRASSRCAEAVNVFYVSHPHQLTQSVDFMRAVFARRSQCMQATWIYQPELQKTDTGLIIQREVYQAFIVRDFVISIDDDHVVRIWKHVDVRRRFGAMGTSLPLHRVALPAFPVTTDITYRCNGVFLLRFSPNHNVVEQYDLLSAVVGKKAFLLPQREYSLPLVTGIVAVKRADPNIIILDKLGNLHVFDCLLGHHVQTYSSTSSSAAGSKRSRTAVSAALPVDFTLDASQIATILYSDGVMRSCNISRGGEWTEVETGDTGCSFSSPSFYTLQSPADVDNNAIDDVVTSLAAAYRLDCSDAHYACSASCVHEAVDGRVTSCITAVAGAKTLLLANAHSAYALVGQDLFVCKQEYRRSDGRRRFGTLSRLTAQQRAIRPAAAITTIAIEKQFAYDVPQVMCGLTTGELIEFSGVE